MSWIHDPIVIQTIIQAVIMVFVIAILTSVIMAWIYWYQIKDYIQLKKLPLISVNDKVVGISFGKYDDYYMPLTIANGDGTSTIIQQLVPGVNYSIVKLNGLGTHYISYKIGRSLRINQSVTVNYKQKKNGEKIIQNIC